MTVDGMATTICSAMNMIHPSWSTAPSSGMRSPASKLVLELGYSIDYEDEKENFEPDEADTVELINGERMPWEQAKRDGIDYIALYYVNEKGKPVQILDAELA